MDKATVKIWDKKAGDIIWEENTLTSYFIYDEDFLKNGFDLSPFIMKRSEGKFPFKSDVSMETVFKNLPPVFADSLPDDFGNNLLKSYLDRTGKKLNPVEKLLYIGKRGMGALEYEPKVKLLKSNENLDLQEIVKILSEILRNKESENLGKIGEEAFLNILKVGVSAGGARAKIIVAMDNETKELKACDVIHKGNYSYWLVKLDGVKGVSITDPQGYSKIEYAYYKMAKIAGIEMNDTFLFQEGPRCHFFTKRFDRTDKVEKIHMLSLAGLRGYNFKDPLGYSYENVFDTIRKLKLSFSAIEQQYIRTLFNIIARNQDDHVKNISFLKEKEGDWKLSPAYDISYSYNPDGYWTKSHQLSLRGKRDNFTQKDLIEFGKVQGIRNPKKYIEQVTEAVSQWEKIAKEVDIPKHQIEKISNAHRLYLGMNK